MAYYIRDDREAPNYRGVGKPIISQVLSQYRDADGRHHYVHAAPTVMHDTCVHARIPGVAHDDSITNPHQRLRLSFEARDRWAAQLGPGHALCWSRLWTNDPQRATDCYFCGEPVVGCG